MKNNSPEKFSSIRLYSTFCILLLLLGCATQSNKCDVKQREYQVLKNDQPKYPQEAYEQGVEGWTVVELTINEQGEPRDVKVVDADPKSVFDAMSVHTATNMKFSPRIISCQPVAVHGVQFRYNFSLKKT